MQSRRQEKLSRLIQRELGEIFLKNGKELFNNSFVSVSGVRISPDLMYAKVYLTVLDEKDPETFCRKINAFTKEIRNLLARRIRNQVRKIPELEFFYDDSLDYADKIDKLFEKIKKDNPENPNDPDKTEET